MTSESCCKGPGYATPLDAMKGPRETLLYVCCIRKSVDPSLPDYLGTVDADPASPTYSQMIHRSYLPNVDDELHHLGWNACSSCYDDEGETRKYLVAPSISTSRVNVFDTAANPKAPQLYKMVEPEILLDNGHAHPHSVHCLASKEVMISTIGDREGNARGSFALFDNKTFEYKGAWEKQSVPFGYDFWYQPRHNVMVSSEWGTMKNILQGFRAEDVAAKKYGSSIHFWNFKERTLIKSVQLGDDGLIPLEVRFPHEPTRAEGWVGCAAGGSLFYFWKDEQGEWQTKLAVKLPELDVEGWREPKVGAILADILLSMDDKYMYVSLWLQGEVHQYDLTIPDKPKLVGKLRFGGLPAVDTSVKVTTPGVEPYKETFHKGKKIHGGPQMMQLSLDGKRLYVTTSLYALWDNQYYPSLSKNGGDIVMVDVDTVNGGLTLNKDFHVDLGKEPGAPSVAHELRYPGGDCSSDIWL